MREIKFRAQRRIESKEWMYGSVITYSDGSILIHDENTKRKPFTGLDYPCDDETLGQYTGLKDKNGVEAYQDDLYRPWDDDRIYQIVWDDANARFKLNQVAGGKWPCDMMMIPYSDGGIIGNIHENPKLLEQSNA